MYVCLPLGTTLAKSERKSFFALSLTLSLNQSRAIAQSLIWQLCSKLARPKNPGSYSRRPKEIHCSIQVRFILALAPFVRPCSSPLTPNASARGSPMNRVVPGLPRCLHSFLALVDLHAYFRWTVSRYISEFRHATLLFFVHRFPMPHVWL